MSDLLEQFKALSIFEKKRVLRKIENHEYGKELKKIKTWFDSTSTTSIANGNRRFINGSWHNRLVIFNGTAKVEPYFSYFDPDNASVKYFKKLSNLTVYFRNHLKFYDNSGDKYFNNGRIIFRTRMYLRQKTASDEIYWELLDMSIEYGFNDVSLFSQLIARFFYENTIKYIENNRLYYWQDINNQSSVLIYNVIFTEARVKLIIDYFLPSYLQSLYAHSSSLSVAQSWDLAKVIFLRTGSNSLTGELLSFYGDLKIFYRLHKYFISFDEFVDLKLLKLNFSSRKQQFETIIGIIGLTYEEKLSHSGISAIFNSNGWTWVDYREWLKQAVSFTLAIASGNPIAIFGAVVINSPVVQSMLATQPKLRIALQITQLVLSARNPEGNWDFNTSYTYFRSINILIDAYSVQLQFKEKKELNKYADLSKQLDNLIMNEEERLIQNYLTSDIYTDIYNYDSFYNISYIN